MSTTNLCLKNSREKYIKELLSINKLKFKNIGSIYSYINYGKPEPTKVILNEYEKLEKINKRRILLAKELKKINVEYDETSKNVHNYLNDIGTKSLEDVVRSVEIDYFFKTHTNYNNLLNDYEDSIARELALKNYSSKKIIPKNISKNINNKLRIEFD
ncbi:MAG: hypothetical protein CMF62_03375 [Magnetococcales bacterium]|nr:hypothetical protein [Magnetococcales bacterium]|tara:strand:- start:1991 stop:2464 length:474 start_codon:yes stop_codon:yes gene_type:complete